MKRYILLFGGVVSAVLLGGMVQSASAQVALSDEHRRIVVSQCSSAQTSLRQLHRSDASLRVNRGQLYEFIGSKLMARLNARLVTNRLDGGALVDLTAQYDRKLDDFRTSYRIYEEQLSALLRVDCAKDPEGFYDGVLATREKRTYVYQQTAALHQIIGEYYEAFQEFSDEYRIAARGVSNGQ